MDQHITELITIIGIVTGLALAYGKAFGSYQSEITQAVIDLLAVGSRYRRILNLATGIVIASGFTVVGAAWLGAWEVVPAGILAGILASVEAGRVHDAGGTSEGVAERANDAGEPAAGAAEAQ